MINDKMAKMAVNTLKNVLRRKDMSRLRHIRCVPTNEWQFSAF
ncbi:hypothetical protein [uncultured Megasphaera sp.]|nr:hypothetical protein [uncultured Megasphaera sp.]